MSAWQPIETAPKDGTWVILSFKGDRPYVGFCDSDQWLDHVLTARQPTHWQPLPEPPEE